MASRQPLISRRNLKSAPLALALCAAIVAAASGQAHAAALTGLDDQPDRTVEELANAPQVLYLDIVMDGQVVRPLVKFRQRDGRLAADPLDLEGAGLQLPEGMVPDAEGLIELNTLPGLVTQYESSMQRVILVPPPTLRRTSHLGYEVPRPVTVVRDHGLALEWDTYARGQDDLYTLSLGTALRWFGRFGTLSMSGVSRAGDGPDDAYSRLDTTWTFSDPMRMWTWSAGDFVSGGTAWSRPVRMGGVQWRRNFGVRPDLVVYPLPQFAADATLPSSVELFVNNVRQYSGDVAPGPFVISDFPRVVGAGQAVVVVTDSLGRTTQTSVPLYVDYQRLARGLTDFSLETGLLRRSFGVASNDYGSDRVASASWRRGMTSDLTVELHGEVGPDMGLAGAGMAWSPGGRYGVITGSMAQSNGNREGEQYSAGYQLFGQRVGFDAYWQRATRDYRDLGSLEGGSVPLREQDRASLWFAVPHGSLSLSWLRYREQNLVLAPQPAIDDSASRTFNLGFNQSYRSFSFYLNAFDDSRAGHGVSFSLSVPLGNNIDSSLNLDRSRGENSAAASLRRNVPYEGGWGWDVLARDNGDGQLGASYRNRFTDLWFGVDRSGGQEGVFGQGLGTFVWMDGQAFATRSVSDSFAVISTNGVGNVPILFENRVAGTTNAEGFLLLPELRGWQRNRISINPDGLPPNVEVPAIERMVTPPDHAGLRVAFALQSVQSATVVLKQGEQFVEAGTRVKRSGGAEGIVAFDGQLWLDHYVGAQTLSWRQGGRDCQVALPSGDAAHVDGKVLQAQCSELGQ